MTFGDHDDDLAEDLADDESDNVLFEDMLSPLIVHWRTVYADLRDNPSGFATRTATGTRTATHRKP